MPRHSISGYPKVDGCSCIGSGIFDQYPDEHKGWVWYHLKAPPAAEFLPCQAVKLDVLLCLQMATEDWLRSLFWGRLCLKHKELNIF